MISTRSRRAQGWPIFHRCAICADECLALLAHVHCRWPSRRLKHDPCSWVSCLSVDWAILTKLNAPQIHTTIRQHRHLLQEQCVLCTVLCRPHYTSLSIWLWELQEPERKTGAQVLKSQVRVRVSSHSIACITSGIQYLYKCKWFPWVWKERSSLLIHGL